ncbi:DUF1330 domain-containing protein [Nocardia sp. NPDC051832]|uniref:DUF1330 domain-containing protein n=1 Tax=Nocardia sp. NPDC051832 TaxID=3155673 RepID=UPI0034416548
MPAYAIAHLHAIRPGPELVEYLRQIDATLTRYGGRFLVHGGAQDALEGPSDAMAVIVEFADLAAVRTWYDSPEYQAIRALRTGNSSSVMIAAPACPADHRAIDIL